MKAIGTMITKSSQTAMQADGLTPLSVNVLGEIRLSLTHRGRPLTLEALVVEDLDVDIFAGTPFMTIGDIAVRPATYKIIIAETDVVSYGYSQPPQSHHAVRACHLLRAPNANTTVWPGEFLYILPPPPELLKDSPLAISSSYLKSTHV